MLVKAGADVNIKDKYGWSALKLAKKQGNRNIVKYLTGDQPLELKD
jgi:ankyrin repeat protein